MRINNGEPNGFDTSAPIVDVTQDLRVGDNTITVRVSSSLSNRLLARGYYDHVHDIVTDWSDIEERTQTTEVHDHGLLGPVRLISEAAIQ